MLLMTHDKIIATSFLLALFELVLQRLSIDPNTTITDDLLAGVRCNAAVIAIQLVYSLKARVEG